MDKSLTEQLNSLTDEQRRALAMLVRVAKTQPSLFEAANHRLKYSALVLRKCFNLLSKQLR